MKNITKSDISKPKFPLMIYDYRKQKFIFSWKMSNLGHDYQQNLISMIV